MDSELLDSFLSQGLDPFLNNYYNVADDLLLKPTNVMKSQITEGPIDLRLSSETSQPFSQSSNFVMFNVDLITKETGSLKSVNSLKLYVPFAIEFSRDVRFCDFEDTGEIEGQFKIYEISESALNNKVNVDCSNNQFYDIESDCIEEYSDVELSCSFAVSQLPEGDLFFKSLIKAEVEYVFEVEKREVITVLEVEDSSDVCENILDETECISTVGCMPSSNGDFESCISCPLSWTNCESYEDELSCGNDWCGFGECNFIEDSCLS
jgi:hypothetical protein